MKKATHSAKTAQLNKLNILAHGLLHVLVLNFITMAIFTKTDMVFKDYRWSAYPNDDPRVTGKPDSTLFNRHEGYEVLYLVNKLAELWTLRVVSACQKMERMIRQHLPSYTRSQTEVQAWIHENWSKY